MVRLASIPSSRPALGAHMQQRTRTNHFRPTQSSAAAGAPSATSRPAAAGAAPAAVGCSAVLAGIGRAGTFDLDTDSSAPFGEIQGQCCPT